MAFLFYKQKTSSYKEVFLVLLYQNDKEHGTAGRTRTDTGVSPRDFKSRVSTIPPRRQN